MATFLLHAETYDEKSCTIGSFKLSFSKQVRFAIAVVSSILSCSVALATQSVSVSWNPGTDAGIAGYVLYSGTNSANLSTRRDVGTNTTAVVSGLAEGQATYFAIAAYNVAGLEGSASSQLSYIVPGYLKMNSTTGKTLTFPVASGHWYEVLAATNLTSWTSIWQTSVSTSNAWVTFQDTQAGSMPKRFYRLVLH